MHCLFVEINDLFTYSNISYTIQYHCYTLYAIGSDDNGDDDANCYKV